MTGVLKHLLSPWIINLASELRACEEPWDISIHETQQWLHQVDEGAVNWLKSMAIRGQLVHLLNESKYSVLIVTTNISLNLS